MRAQTIAQKLTALVDEVMTQLARDGDVDVGEHIAELAEELATQGMPMVVVSIRLPVADRDWLKATAKARKVAVSGVIRDLIQQAREAEKGGGSGI